ncbi:hypothetical protein L227DRAFT_652553 [Lentinus tigrinus ALCF2SS1-6]|uniref:Uncharacterized protein n=1 Tax=Lentinus tigrinus ALCF2SS1-6 TaxID=1328759 RepID=A0A5C2SBV5_9APHY|nr:hypothetical protein L227DRAFT_652553 [Lentinus tigrinus ALCF2SS1-6]
MRHTAQTLVHLTLDIPAVMGLIHDIADIPIVTKAEPDLLIRRHREIPTDAKNANVFDLRQKIRANALKVVKILLSVSATRGIAATKQELSDLGRLFDRVTTEGARVILEVHYGARWAGQRDGDGRDSEETLRRPGELEPDLEVLRERLRSVVSGSPPRAVERGEPS